MTAIFASAPRNKDQASVDEPALATSVGDGAAEEADGSAYGLNRPGDGVDADMAPDVDGAICRDAARGCDPDYADCPEPGEVDAERRAYERSMRIDVQRRCVEAKTRDREACVAEQKLTAEAFCEQGILPNGKQYTGMDENGEAACRNLWQEGLPGSSVTRSSASAWSLELSVTSRVVGLTGGHERGTGTEYTDTTDPVVGYEQRCAAEAARLDCKDEGAR